MLPFNQEISDFRPCIWAVRFVVHGLTTHDWRRRVLDRHHRRTQSEIRIGDQASLVDSRLALVLAYLNDRGFITEFSCQGIGLLELVLLDGPRPNCHSLSAYIKLADGGTFPEDLLTAARHAGFFTLVKHLGGSFSLRVLPLVPDAFAPAFNAAFRRLFQDYLDNRLDLTGRRYQRMVPTWLVEFCSRYSFEAEVEAVSQEGLESTSGATPAPCA